MLDMHMRFGCDNSPDEGIVKFLEKFGAISHLRACTVQTSQSAYPSTGIVDCPAERNVDGRFARPWSSGGSRVPDDWRGLRYRRYNARLGAPLLVAYSSATAAAAAAVPC